MENTEELRQLLEQSQSGNWIPLGIVTAAMSLVMILLIYIWNQFHQNNKRQHEETKEILKETSKALTALEKLVTAHETKIDYLEKNI